MALLDPKPSTKNMVSRGSTLTTCFVDQQRDYASGEGPDSQGSYQVNSNPTKGNCEYKFSIMKRSLYTHLELRFGGFVHLSDTRDISRPGNGECVSEGGIHREIEYRV